LKTLKSERGRGNEKKNIKKRERGKEKEKKTLKE
jgi:hypothetical protein